eukprot:TRINITY_DN18596_c0_g1_i5.p1 TRINITY_DN18596_c0_g1~~TRINITY_DN18596_c0_g1_i5.p1  ORF type:complete len:436 (-),score=56.36 TRINITY_DN18596_c0_g1_i5:31-1338(-)
MQHGVEYVRCTVFMLLFSFKPSEPHLSKYLEEVMHLSQQQRDAEVYPIDTYGSLVVVALVGVLSILGMKKASRACFTRDKVIILVGCSGRCATRLLLVFGKTLFHMQLMQATYAIGMIGEIGFYAYCLKAIPGQGQRLVAITQASHLISHTFAGICGDLLLSQTDIGLVGLVRISACSVISAALVACTFRSAVVTHETAMPQSTDLFRAVYSHRGFWISTLWWVWSYPVYMTIYGYESSIYSDNIKGHDYNGSIFAVGLLAGAACSFLLSFERVEVLARRAPLAVFATSSIVLTVTATTMSYIPDDEIVLAISFTVFFMAWSFANTLFYGETCSAVNDGILQLEETSLTPVGSAEAVVARVVSVLVFLNFAAGTLANGLTAFVQFTLLDLSVEVVFQQMAAIQAVVTCGILVALGVTYLRSGRTGTQFVQMETPS